MNYLKELINYYKLTKFMILKMYLSVKEYLIMKLIAVRNNTLEKPSFRTDCGRCGSTFEVEASDMEVLERVLDFRDGDYYKVPCPALRCGHINHIAASLLP